MRALIPGLQSPHPLGAALPPLFQDDDFVQRFSLALDEVLAPVLCALDNLDAYFDPRLAPEDFLDWLAAWVGTELDGNWDVDRRRSVVVRATGMHRSRGTVAGLRDEIALYTGTEPEIVEGGGASWSRAPAGPLPGTGEPSVTVRVTATEAQPIDLERLDAIVVWAKPAHLSHVVEVERR